MERHRVEDPVANQEDGTTRSGAEQRARARESPDRARLFDVLIVLALVGISLWRLIPAVATTPFHRDEARWIGNSAILREWRHPLGIRWKDEGYANRYGTIDEVNRRRSQPPFAMYVFGFGLLLQGEGLPQTGYWIMSQDTGWNIAHGNMPPAGEIRSARRTNVAIAVLTVLTIFAIGRRIANRLGGVTAAVIYALHPLVLDTSTRAWSDPLLTLCLAVAALAAVRLADRPTWGRAATLGIVLGLGAATKLSPLPLAAGLGIVGTLLLVASPFSGQIGAAGRTLGIRLLAVPGIAFATLVAVYPYLWTNPVSHTLRMFEFRSTSFDLQASSFPPAAVTSRGNALSRVWQELGDRFSTSGMVGEYIGRLIDREAWSWLGRLDIVLAMLGVGIVLHMIARNGIASPAGMVTAVIAGQTLLILVTIRVEYARYLLPIALFNAIYAGVAISKLWQLGRCLIVRSTTKRSW